jgi:hypothetical protein
MVEFVDVFLLMILTVKLRLLGYFFLSFELNGFGQGTFLSPSSFMEIFWQYDPFVLGVNLLVPREALGKVKSHQ